MGDDALLDAWGVSKSFANVTALDDVSLRVRRGTIHALMSEALGFAGLMGTGRTQVMEAIFGMRPINTGLI